MGPTKGQSGLRMATYIEFSWGLVWHPSETKGELVEREAQACRKVDIRVHNLVQPAQKGTGSLGRVAID